MKGRLEDGESGDSRHMSEYPAESMEEVSPVNVSGEAKDFPKRYVLTQMACRSNRYYVTSASLGIEEPTFWRTRTTKHRSKGRTTDTRRGNSHGKRWKSQLRRFPEIILRRGDNHQRLNRRGKLDSRVPAQKTCLANQRPTRKGNYPVVKESWRQPTVREAVALVGSRREDY